MCMIKSKGNCQLLVDNQLKNPHGYCYINNGLTLKCVDIDISTFKGLLIIFVDKIHPNYTIG